MKKKTNPKKENKDSNLPTISVVMPVYNEEEKIERCLKSIREQDYPQNKIEIVFVNDDSTDNTLKIAKKYNIKLVRNGNHDYDIGKSIGIKNSKNEYLLFMDADNFFTKKTSIRELLHPLLTNKEVIGSQPIWFEYKKEYPRADRYAILFGITDPLTIFLKKRDRLTLYEKKWNLVPNVKEIDNYFLAEFNKKNLVTTGTVGFMIKKSYILKTNYDPEFSHLDCMMDLVKQGYNKFAFVKLDIIHLHSKTINEFLRKLKRNMKIFLSDQKRRRYKWETSKWQLFLAILAMSTIIIPLYQSIRGYLKIHDFTWFLHPYICLYVVIMYSYLIITWKLKSLFGLNKERKDKSLH